MKELQKSSILSVLGAGKSSGGRKPLLYKLNAEAFYVIGVDLSVDDIRVALFNFETQIVAQARKNVPESGEPEDYVQSVADLIQSLIKQAGIVEDKILGVGVSAPGPINEETGEMIHPPNLPRWSVFPFRRRLEEELRTPVKLEKDANVSALGEKWFGAGQDANHLIYIMVGEGIGGGIVIGGRLHRENRFGAGEIGHGTIDLDGPRCYCGNYGCLEAMASGLAMVRRIGEELRREVLLSSCTEKTPASMSGEMNRCVGRERDSPLSRPTLPVLFEQVPTLLLFDWLSRFESASKRRSFDATCGGGSFSILGIGIVGIVNAFQPQKVIIGGKIPRAYPKMVEIAADIAKRRVLSVCRDQVRIVPSFLGGKSAVTGAAALVLEEIFTYHFTGGGSFCEARRNHRDGIDVAVAGWVHFRWEGQWESGTDVLAGREPGGSGIRQGSGERVECETPQHSSQNATASGQPVCGRSVVDFDCGRNDTGCVLQHQSGCHRAICGSRRVAADRQH
ncbi:ROK family protein [Polycladomyces sp. WAk]|uniref:ROK family protein n=1 Tax=Polycladomyces zharkentensis TaxID=2807616 RepID=A0ABS2WF02_9BACL|nr:ROK family protein [Polycladomyces sp. WAk]